MRGLGIVGSHADQVLSKTMIGSSPLQVDSVLLHNLEAADLLSHQLSSGSFNRHKKMGAGDVYLSSTSLPPLLRFRSEFSSAVWDSISSLYRNQPFAEAVDIDCTYGRAAVQLARRGFRVTGIEPDVQLLAKARLSASAQGVELRLLGAEQEKQRLEAGCAQLVSVMHGFHLMHAPSALEEMHRLLQPGGFLVVAWNDRDGDDLMVQDLEELMEGISSTYNRSHRLHDPAAWLPILTQGNLFKLHSFEQHSNSMPLRQVSELVELLSSMRFMRPHLAAPEARKQFAHDVRELALRHFPSLQQLALQLVSKLYILQRQ